MDNLSEKFELFMAACRNDMYKYCISLTGNEFDADDVLNEAFTRLWNIWHERADLPENYNRGWITLTIQNVVKEHKRKKQRIVLCGDEVLNILKHDNSISKFEENEQFNQYLKDIMAELDYYEREIFTMYFIEKRTYKFISKKMGVRNGTLRVQISRLRNRLQTKIDEIIK